MPTAIPKVISVNYDEKAFWRRGPKADDFDHINVLSDITRRAIHFMGKQAARGNPFFLYIALTAPHAPIIPTSEFIGKIPFNEKNVAPSNSNIMP